jgi:hypothetical protein
MNIAVIGGGPAGLRAAEVASAAGARVTLYDAKPSPGRKFLVAGRGGLNLSKAESPERFVTRYGEPSPLWASLIAGFDAAALQAWAAEYEVELFTASTGRIYPRGLKAAPLLRRWVQRLRSREVVFRMNHRWVGLRPGSPLQLEFETDGQRIHASADAVILALGGASWPETGSDGQWSKLLAGQGIAVTPLQPANCGWEVAWPASVLAQAEGLPLKNITARAGSLEASGELLITRYGVEGGALYQLGPALRQMGQPCVVVNLKPSLSRERLIAKMGPAWRNLLAEARQRLKLDAAAVALLEWRAQQRGAGRYETVEGLVDDVRALPIPLLHPRPMAEAISTTGGIAWSELTDGLMLRQMPGVFAAGEMIDWEAPTGGYLIHGCLATGTRAARAALEWGRR